MVLGLGTTAEAGVTVAALYVQRGGCYFGLPDVDPWDEQRDARQYPGPHPVVAHPPCARWGRYWSGGPSAHGTRELGADDGCFAAALESVRTWGGVLEHPEASHAWDFFGLRRPHRSGGWQRTLCDGWTCCVEQGHYGHAARKATWLYVAGCVPPDLIWGPSEARGRQEDSYRSTEERRRAIKTGACQRLSARQRPRRPSRSATYYCRLRGNANV